MQLNSSTPIKAVTGRRPNTMPWFCSSSPIEKSSRPPDTTASPVLSAGVLSIEFEIQSSDEEFIPKQKQNKKSLSNQIKLAAKSEKNRDRVRSRASRNMVKKTAITRQYELESSDSDIIITSKRRVHKTERTTPISEKGRKKRIPTKDQSYTSSKDKKKISAASPLQVSSVKKDSPVGNIPAVFPRRKSSVRIHSKTVSLTENSSSSAKKRSQLGSATKSMEVVKRKIDFGSEEMEELIPLRTSVVKNVGQNKSVRFSMESKKNLNLTGLSSASRNAGSSKTGKKKSMSFQSVQSNNEFDGRSSKRKRVPTSAFWLGQAVHEDENIFGTKSTNKVQPEHNVVSDNEVTKKKPRLTIKAQSNLKKKTPIRDGPKKKRNTHEQTVCLAVFNDAQFESHGEGDTSGVLRATSMFLNDSESQYIQLPPREETGDLCSYIYNQLYTVLENQVSLEIDGILKDISLHGQFHICKGVSHRVYNKTNRKSLVQRIIIHK